MIFKQIPEVLNDTYPRFAQLVIVPVLAEEAPARGKRRGGTWA